MSYNPGALGTVTSVAITVPSILSVAGSPVTTTGTFAVTLATEAANVVFAGPVSGGSATPTFRALVAADLPSGTLSGSLTSGRVPFANGSASLTDDAALTFSTASGFSVKRNANGGEFFGLNAGNTTATGQDNTVIGSGSATALSTGSRNVLIGQGAGVAITSDTQNVGVGAHSLDQLVASSGKNTALGYQAGHTASTATQCIYLGNASGDSTSPSATGHFIAGSGAAPISSVWFGNGETNSSPTAVIHNVTGGSGTDIAGASHTIAGGIGTGAGAGGAIIFKTASVTTSSSTPNTLTTRLTVGGDGGIQWTGIATAAAPALSASNNGTIYYDATLQQFMASSNGGAYAALSGGGGGITGTLASGRVTFASGTSTVTDSAQLVFSTANGLSSNRPNTTGTECYGLAAGNTSMTGDHNTLLGASSGHALTSGSLNTAVGFDALLTATTDSQHTAVGYQALKFVNTASVGSTAVGINACGSMTTAGGCVAVGGAALFVWDTNGGNSTAVGFSALRGSGVIANNTGSANTALGFQALTGMTSGANNVALGVNAGQSITSGSFNIFLGSTAGDSTAITASNRLVVGSSTASITTAWFGNGETNTSPASVAFNVTGGSGANVAGGALTLAGGIGTGTGVGGAITFQTAPVTTSGSTPNTLTNRFTIGGDGGTKWTGIATTAAPATSGANNATLYYDSTLQQFMLSTNNGAYAAFGSGTLSGSLTSGRVPFASGSTALSDSSTMTFSTSNGLSVNIGGTSGCEYLGSLAGNATASGVDTTCVGNTAGHTMTTAASCTFLGRQAGASNTTTGSCTYLGAYSGQFMRGLSNVAIGVSALAGTGPASSDTGHNNVVVGNSAANSVSTASSNVVIGDQCGQGLGTGGNNVMIGALAGANTTSGGSNIFLGAASGDGTAATASNRFVVGSSTSAISNAFFGNGETNSSPAQCDIRATGGLGTDVAGAALSLDGGASTGAGVGGNVVIRTTKASTSSNTLNTLNTCLTVDQKGNIVPGSGALATTATDGFTYVETCAGTPTGVPTTFTGRAAMVYDSSNNKLYVYNGAWKGVVLT